jgi:flagellar basal body-associated protein FliL
MRLRVNPYKFGLLPASLAFTLLMLIVIITGSLIPQVYGLNFNNHQICKGWTQQNEPITANKFNTGETVYLYFRISWTGIQEYEQTWGDIPTMQQGLSSAGSMTELYQLETFKISLADPSGAEVNTFSTRAMHQVECEPPGCVSSAFLEIINVTSTTKNGRWKLNWYDGNTLLFSEEFVVGEEQAGPSPSQGQQTLEPSPSPGQQTPLDILGPLIAVIIAIIIALVAIIIYLSRRKKKIPETPETPPPPPPTL